MKKEITLSVVPEIAMHEESLRAAVAKELGIDSKDIKSIHTLRRSIDARRRPVRYQLVLEIWVGEARPAPEHFNFELPKIADAPRVVVAGTGPAGLFAALRLIKLGFKPILIERGKDIRERRRDIAAIHKQHLIDADSNYCFGEGGAGTYSDGKLYTRSGNKHEIREILKILVSFGASEEILIDTHPHIGTNKLPQLVASIREAILNAGGEMHFNTRIVGLKLDTTGFRGVLTASGDLLEGKALILATGHSARDIFLMLQRLEVAIEFKPFALGVRVEHPQALIDTLQYHTNNRNKFLPPASYALTSQVQGLGVYSFCMCPGGIIAPCATEANQVVTNGWSPSKRNNPYANSGIVVPCDLPNLERTQSGDPLVGMKFQQEIEERAWAAGGKSQVAPAQRLTDFLTKRTSTNLPSCSYGPGVTSSNLHDILPDFIAARLVAGFEEFGKKMKGFLTQEAIVVGVESRTSSPVRIPRDATTLQHPQISGLFPCGEGAGFAGGIISAALDGQKCANQCANWLS